MPTAIEWTKEDGRIGETWNPIAGCTKVSQGCKHCYAIRQATRMAGNPNPKIGEKYAPTVARGNWTGVITVDDDALLKPLRWRKPRTVFVNSMSDLFHENVTNDTIDRVFTIMAQTPRHHYQVLTKRAKRLPEFMEHALFIEARNTWSPHYWGLGDNWPFPNARSMFKQPGGESWPLPNVAIGVSVETQEYIGRIADLCETPAALRFVSVEPLLGPLSVYQTGTSFMTCDPASFNFVWGIDQVIIGCESHGSSLGRLSVDGKATPQTWLGWAIDLADQCRASGVRLFVKQIPALDGRLLHARNAQAELHMWPEALRSWELLPWGDS